MEFPILNVKQKSRQMSDAFLGYNHNLRIGENEFYDMKNLTSDYYPVLAPRGVRGIYAYTGKPNGLIAKDALCYVDGSKFVINEYDVDMGLSDGPKQLVSMGAKVIILPDKKYFNTQNLRDFGDIEAHVTTSGKVTFELCKVDGASYYDDVKDIPHQDDEPKDPANLDLWIDTSTTPHTLKQ